MIRKLKLEKVVIRATIFNAVVVVVDQRDVVAVVDVPVELDEVFLVRLRAIARSSTRIVVVQVASNVADALEVGLWQPGANFTEARTSRTGGQEFRQLSFFVCNEEEQLVLNDRTAD